MGEQASVEPGLHAPPPEQASQAPQWQTCVPLLQLPQDWDEPSVHPLLTALHAPHV